MDQSSKEALVHAMVEFSLFVRDVRDYYSWFSEDELVCEIAEMLGYPVERISPLVRQALSLLQQSGQI